MFLLEETVVTSASDITAFCMCPFAFARRLDKKLGRDVEIPDDEDAMLERAARLGDAHEAKILAQYQSTGHVLEISRTSRLDAQALQEAQSATLEALRARAATIFQATFFDPDHDAAPAPGEAQIGFVGFADFLVLNRDGTYEVEDAKLARRAKVTAIFQLAAYADQLRRLDVPVSTQAALLLGSGERSVHNLADIEPVFRRQRERMHELIRDRYRLIGADGSRASGEPVAWGKVPSCGACEVCTPEVEASRDVLLVAGLRPTQREAFLAAGISTIDELAELSGTSHVVIPGIAPSVLRKLSLQARLQIDSEQLAEPLVRVVAPEALGSLPKPDPGDIFFDFEGDPLYQERPDYQRKFLGREGTSWGLDYLFGLVDTDEQFHTFWAHNLDGERRALLEFLDFVEKRRARFPEMHIYHYAPYEKTHLRSMAARHGVGEKQVDQLLRDGVLVDLYASVRKAFRIGVRSYSIKKLEPLYMKDSIRTGVTNAADSVSEYADAMLLKNSESDRDRQEGQRMLDAIAEYNRYDCVSTLKLRNWLLTIAQEHNISPASIDDDPGETELQDLELSLLATALLNAGDENEHDDESAALHLASAAIDYHERELKSFWWAHYERLENPIEEWADQRDVFVIEHAEIIRDWYMRPRARSNMTRELRITGTAAPGSSIKADREYFLVYNGAPATTVLCRVLEVDEAHILIEEAVSAERAGYTDGPIALVPGPPPRAGAQKTAIEEWGQNLLRDLDESSVPRNTAFDLLLRRPSSRPLAQAGESVDDSAAISSSRVSAVVQSILEMGRSAISVQGPPGTGKTYLAARVIRTLVEEYGWHVGVVAQSHKVVENVLESVVTAGLSAEQVGKARQRGSEPNEEPFTVIPAGKHQQFVHAHRLAGRGSVTGGTAWDFSNQTRFERDSLDVLVIDEAGQFSLASTIAASVAAHRLLLLGDPQQLPQVTQGVHPFPVDTSALNWVLGEHATMPVESGYFLAESWRMHPALCEVVSDLSYEGRLHAAQVSNRPQLLNAGPPGLMWHGVDHKHNSTRSPEEADVVAEICQRLMNAQVDSGGSVAQQPQTSNLSQEDIIVVAAYNAQVETIRGFLEAKGLARIRVGTVDKFQGQEARIAIVSLAASTAKDIPRGVEFLLMRNRLNVAISRAQWSCHLVSSRTLGDSLPATADGVKALSGYLGLIERAQPGCLE